MGFSDAVRSGFRNWNKPQGRSSRSEYWWWVLFYVLAVIAFALIASLVAAVVAGGSAARSPNAFASVLALLIVIWTVVLIAPTLAVSIRRLHDTDRSGWWLLLNFVPYVGSLILLVIYCLDGSPGPNRFGPRPGGNLATYRAQGGPLIGVADELRKLDELKAAGTISQAEFDRQRARLLPE